MTGVAGYGASIKKSGSTTVFVNEDFTNTTGDTWQIDDTVKRVFDKDSLPGFYDDNIAIPANEVQSIDYLYGRVTFTSTKVGPIVANGSYFPMLEIAGAKEISLNRTVAIHDDTSTGNAGFHTKVYGLQDITMTLSRWDDLTKEFTNILKNRKEVIIEFAPTVDKSYRGWFVIDSAGQSLDLNALIEESISFQLAGDDEAGKTFSRSDA